MFLIFSRATFVTTQSYLEVDVVRLRSFSDPTPAFYSILGWEVLLIQAGEEIHVLPNSCNEWADVFAEKG